MVVCCLYVLQGSRQMSETAQLTFVCAVLHYYAFAFQLLFPFLLLAFFAINL